MEVSHKTFLSSPKEWDGGDRRFEFEVNDLRLKDIIIFFFFGMEPMEESQIEARPESGSKSVVARPLGTPSRHPAPSKMHSFLALVQ